MRGYSEYFELHVRIFFVKIFTLSTKLNAAKLKIYSFLLSMTHFRQDNEQSTEGMSPSIWLSPLTIIMGSLAR